MRICQARLSFAFFISLPFLINGLGKMRELERSSAEKSVHLPPDKVTASE
jgi:hypothetical protein